MTIALGPQRLTGSGASQTLPCESRRVSASSASPGRRHCTLPHLRLLVAHPLIGICLARLRCLALHRADSTTMGYRGLGEVMVFIFFGLIAVMGTQLTQPGQHQLGRCKEVVAVGAFSCANNLVDNLRAIPSDTASGNTTLAVRLGDKRTRTLDALGVRTVHPEPQKWH
ncbi:MAG: hypothetical protein U1U88_000848 [Lawsonella clevelandensis]